MGREQYRIDRQYLADLLAALKDLRRRIDAAGQEAEKWRQRLELARQNSREELISSAEKRVRNAEEILSSLKGEERKLLVEIETARRQFQQSSLTKTVEVDAQELLRQLENLAGPPDPLESSAKESAAEEELERLRRRLHNENGHGE